MKKIITDWIDNEKNKEIVEFIKSIIFALIIALTLRSSVVEANYIFSGSMTPTLLAGDYVLVYKMAYNLRIPFTSVNVYNFGTPKRGDIITFIYPQDNSKIFVKRAIGLPGDMIEIRDQELYINNQKIKRVPMENYEASYTAFVEYLENHPHSIIQNKTHSIYGNYKPIKVPEDCIFVLGDNRDNSADSRFWGFVPFQNVLGKAFTIYFSNSETLDWPFPAVFSWFKGIRFNRIGTWLANK